MNAKLFLAAAVIAAVPHAWAHDAADEAAEYRQSLMNVVEWNVSPMGKMVKGKTPFDAVEFSRRADRLAAVSDQLVEGFGADTDKAKHSHAKADIWTHMDDFKAKANDFDREAKALATVAKGKDEAKDKEQFKKMTETCKACHDKYKQKD